MLRDLFQLSVSADESDGVLELYFIPQLSVDGFELLLQLFLHLLFLSSSDDRGALHLIQSSLSADLS